MTDTIVDVAALRKMAGVTQAEMAHAMELPVRTYEDIEAGRVAFRPVHQTAARFALLRIAAAKGDASFLPAGVRGLVYDVAQLIPKREKPAS